MRFAFIAAKKAEHRVTILCRCMRVTRSGFYAWLRRGLSARAQRDLVLRTKLRAFHTASGQIYGRPRLWKDLHEDGEAVSESQVHMTASDEVVRDRAKLRASELIAETNPPSARRPMQPPVRLRTGESTLLPIDAKPVLAVTIKTRQFHPPRARVGCIRG